MSIKPNHGHVDAEGLLYSPYLSSWGPRGGRERTLGGLVSEARAIFGAEPPVYATGGGGGGGGRSTVRSGPPSYGEVGGRTGVSTTTTTAAAAGRGTTGGTVLERLTGKIQMKVQGVFNELRTKMEDELKVQAGLTANGEAVGRQMGELGRMKTLIETAVSDVKERRRVLEERVDKRNREASAGTKVNVDDLVKGVDANSEKALELAAGVAAGEDLVYYIDRALIAGGGDVEEGMREVRRTARQQFLKKAWLRKIGKGTGGEGWELR
ncbi:hypothetical protein TrCOL_g13611 [Triparma columacea]|nr:hypothetical protein TrCOL_g13611 [Triparma columacea]